MIDTMHDALPPLLFMWENLGPTHHDRLAAVAAAGFDVEAIELSATSSVYDWERTDATPYRVQTLEPSTGTTAAPVMFWRLLTACRRSRARHLFLCHYERFAVFAVAAVMRLLGRRVFIMLDSKFDDYPRFLWREVGKSLFVVPYSGGLVGSRRSRDYLNFLGMRGKPIELGYDTIDIARFRPDDDADEVPFATRPFLIVARLVPKKNISAVLRAFAAYRTMHGEARELHIIGYGSDRDALEAEAKTLGIADAVRFLGLQPSDEVARAMGSSLALILASTEEQFGLVVNEALAAGLPVIVSGNAGASDYLIENLGNGIHINPYDQGCIVSAMAHVGSDEATWRSMRARALETAERGDARHFVSAVHDLVRRPMSARAAALAPA